jgi:8-amino-7-oxononanoate synthase
MSAEARLGAGLADLERQGLLRQRRILEGAQGASVSVESAWLANFSSNDYLGLASDPRLKEAAHRAIDAYGVGAGASPIVSGHARAHEEAELRFASFCGLPRAPRRARHRASSAFRPSRRYRTTRSADSRRSPLDSRRS